MEREYIEGVDPGMQPGMESGMRSPTSKDVGDVVEEPMAAPVYRDREISAVEAQEDLGKFARNHMVFILYLSKRVLANMCFSGIPISINDFTDEQSLWRLAKETF